MTITFLCSCGKLIGADDAWVGKRVMCPLCHQEQITPSTSVHEVPLPTALPTWLEDVRKAEGIPTSKADGSEHAVVVGPPKTAESLTDRGRPVGGAYQPGAVAGKEVAVESLPAEPATNGENRRRLGICFSFRIALYTGTRRPVFQQQFATRIGW